MIRITIDYNNRISLISKTKEIILTQNLPRVQDLYYIVFQNRIIRYLIGRIKDNINDI